MNAAAAEGHAPFTMTNETATSSAQRGEVESSSSGINWDTIMLTLFFIVGLITLIFLIFAVWKRPSKSSLTSSRGDIEAGGDQDRPGCYSKGSCFAFPQGRVVLVPILVQMIAFAVSVYSIVTCDFLTVNIQRESNQSLGMFQFSYAFYTNEYGSADTCRDYPEGTKFDSYFMASKVFGVMAATIGGIAMLYTSLSAHCAMSRMALRGTTGVLMLTMLLQALTLIMIESEPCKGDLVECQLSVGAYYSIVSTGYWCLAALAVCILQL